MRPLRKAGLILLSVVCGMALWAGAVVGVDHIRALVFEGYPSATFANVGTHVVVPGAMPSSPLPGGATATLSQPLQALFDQSGGRALIVVHKGQLRIEHYAPGFDASVRFNSFSLVKSLVGALTLRAIDDGHLTFETEVRLSGRNSDAEQSGTRSGETVTVGELLEMRSGLHYAAFGGLITRSMASPKDKDFERTLFNPLGPMARLHFGNLDTVRKKLVTVRSPDGVAPFSYQNVNTALLGQLLEDRTTTSLHQLLSDQVWQPAGAGTAQWRSYPAGGRATPYCCLFATARDWARVGAFLLRNGQPDARLLEPERWRAFVSPDLTEASNNVAYGRHIRHDILDRPSEPLQGRFAYMMGQGGQVVHLVPSHDLVVVRFGGRHQRLHSTLYQVWRQLMGGVSGG